MTDAWDGLRPVVERRVASLLPLSLYGPDQFADELSQLSRLLERRPRSGGYTIWVEIAEWCVAWLGYVTGALLARLERYEALRPLLTSTWSTQTGRTDQTVAFRDKRAWRSEVRWLRLHRGGHGFHRHGSS